MENKNLYVIAPKKMYIPVVQEEEKKGIFVSSLWSTTKKRSSPLFTVLDNIEYINKQYLWHEIRDGQRESLPDVRGAHCIIVYYGEYHFAHFNPDGTEPTFKVRRLNTDPLVIPAYRVTKWLRLEDII